MHFNSVSNKKKSKLKMPKLVKKNNFKIMKKSYAHLQSYIKICVKFQKDQPKTVRGVVLTRYLLHMHFNSVRDKKKSG